MKGFRNSNINNNNKKNMNTKPSKEQLINQAFQFHLKGNIPEATKCYQQLISQGCNDHGVFSNYGAILQGLGKIKEAEISYRKAIELNPNFANAHSNLGNILRDLGNLQDAELSTRKAIEIDPNFANAHSNLGNILRDLGNLQDAELSTRKAIEIDPNFANAHSNLGNILIDLGNLQDAELSTRKAIQLDPNLANAHSNLGLILRDLGNLKESFDSYLRVIEIDRTYPNIYSFITELLYDSDPTQLNKSKLKNILNILLEKNNISHNELFKVFNFLYRKEILSNLEKFNSDFSKLELLINEKVIINALKKIMFCDCKLEKFLTKIRRNICRRIYTNIENINYSELEFIIALGEQCFLNEYVYSITEEEKVNLNIIIKRCQDNELNETNISILSCYFPLYKILDQIPNLKSFNSSNQSFKELIRLQIIEPIQEIELSQKIKKLGPINDDISQKVKSQYEENPYPRWRYEKHNESQDISILQVINNEIKPNYISHNLGDDQLKVLIAGCGTGNQLLQTQRYKNAQITAIDLSLSSLAYAQRKINELEIDNVELIQMDILEVELLKEQFDIVECGGVLHHMNNPSRGLQALLGISKNNGYLKLGLYSELARKDIVKAKNYIANKKLQVNEDSIRNFRQRIISGELSDLNSLEILKDFYSLSEFRDLCFHIQEHRFTIDQLKKTLKSNELTFLGFLLPQPVKSLYKQYFPEDTEQTNLENWAILEEKYPNTFISMYQFWVCKI